MLFVASSINDCDVGAIHFTGNPAFGSSYGAKFRYNAIFYKTFDYIRTDKN